MSDTRVGTSGIFNLPAAGNRSRSLSYHVTPKQNASAGLLILANPLGASYKLWDPLMPLFIKLGFQVLRFDHPGHNLSSCSQEEAAMTTFPSMVQGLGALISHLASDQVSAKCHISLPAAAWMGVSLGAALGVFYATTFPGQIRNLVLCDTISASPANVGVPDLFTPRVAQARADGNMSKTLLEIADRWFGNRLSPDEKKRMVDVGVLKASIDGYEACCSALVHTSFDLRPLAPDLAKNVAEKVYVVVGDLDANLPESMNELANSITSGFKKHRHDDSRSYIVPVTKIPHAGHVPFIDNHAGFVTQVIDGFLPLCK